VATRLFQTKSHGVKFLKILSKWIDNLLEGPKRFSQTDHTSRAFNANLQDPGPGELFNYMRILRIRDFSFTRLKIFLKLRISAQLLKPIFQTSINKSYLLYFEEFQNKN